MGIAREIGMPIQINKATREKSFGYYARLLVEVDLLGSLPNSVMVELPDEDGFSVDLVYEYLPPKFTIYGLIGYERVDCRNLGEEDCVFAAIHIQPSEKDILEQQIQWVLNGINNSRDKRGNNYLENISDREYQDINKEDIWIPVVTKSQRKVMKPPFKLLSTYNAKPCLSKGRLSERIN
ncbi:hypothetical protein QYF36_026832 [Acer negundo]|nr:hypothetical protein QYF36_026832 [Acer negundo]